jgi:hypothetical protein
LLHTWFVQRGDGLILRTLSLNFALTPKLQHYLTSQGLSDAQIQLISGHKTKKSLEVYQHLSLQAVESAYQEAIHSLNI